MKNLVIISINLLFLLVLSCENEQNNLTTSIDCQNLKSGLLEYNIDAVKNEINKITSDLTPNVSESDSIGHRENLDVLIKKLNECNGLIAEMHCYGCIYTYPAKSELLITIDSAYQETLRVVDILTPENDNLSFSAVHEYFNSGVNLEKTYYKGCFIEKPDFRSNDLKNLNDTLFYEIDKDTLTFTILLNYNCCGLLNDSVTIENEQINIHISDTCSGDYCKCRCMCDYEFEYKFTEFWQKNSHFKVFLKELNKTEYRFWKETKFIDGLD